MHRYERAIVLCGALAFWSVLALGFSPGRGGTSEPPLERKSTPPAPAGVKSDAPTSIESNPPTQIASDSPTRVVVIGTVHEDTAQFKSGTLVDILRRVRPDVILLEFDSSFFDSASALLEKFRGITLESRAVTTLQKELAVKVRPYDIEGRNAFYADHDYFKLEGELNRELNGLSAENGLPAEAKLTFETLRVLSAIRDAIAAERPEVINSGASDTALEKKEDYSFKGMRRIIALTPALNKYDAFGALADEFWMRRNEAMIGNVTKCAKEFRGKTIAVLCGYEHRYFLRKGLKEREAKENLVVREYWND